MKQTLYFAVDTITMGVTIYRQMPKMRISGEDVLYEGDELMPHMYWIDKLLPNLYPEGGGVAKVEVEELEDGSYHLRRLPL